MGKFNVGSLPRMINKEVFGKPFYVTANLINWKTVYNEKKKKRKIIILVKRVGKG